MTRVLPLLSLLGLVCLLAAPTAPAADSPDALKEKARGVLAQLDGELAIPGLKEPVEVLRDRWGIPHIYAKNDEDLFFAQGFVAAQDRLFQLDMWRRVAIGETSEVLGKEGLAGDRFARLMQFRGDMAAEWASYSPDTRRILTAFTRGINAYIDHVGKRLPIEFQLLGYTPAKWQPEDVLGRMSGIIMCSNFRNEIARAQLVAAVGVEKARRLAPTDPARDFAPVPGLDLKGIDRTLLSSYNAATRPFPFEKTGGGSNNWTIDGTLSASGKPMLASDPHRAITVPSLRYLVHLNAPGWNVIGAGEPALPGVALGHNERIAWGFTIVGTDQADWYIEDTKPGDPRQYRVGSGWEKMKIISTKVKVKGQAEPVELELRFTRHGPVVHQDEARQRAYVLRWVGQEPGTAAYLGSLAVDRAKDRQEFLEALRAWKVPALNFVYADVDGTVGWIAAGLTPVRKGWDGLLPVPGAAGEYEWQRFLEVKEYPQVFNPQRHWVATANHNILPPAYAPPLSYEWAPPYRYQRIQQRMEGKKKFDLDDFKSMQHDNTSLPGQALVRLLKNVKLKDAALKPQVDALLRWDGVLSADSAPGMLYSIWLQELLTEFFQPHVPKELLDFVRGGRGVEVLLAALEKADPTWFGKDAPAARDRLLETTLAAAERKLREFERQGRSPWGQLHVTPFRHPLSPLGEAYGKAFNLGPVPYGGDANTPNNGRFNEKFEKIHGASYRHVFDLADWDRGMATSVPGQSGQPGSPHYDDLLPLWEKGEYFPLAYSRAKVQEVTRHRLLLKPAS
jgi:penicillin amidase